MGSRALYGLLGLVLVLLLGAPIAIGFVVEQLHAELMRDVGAQTDAAYEISGSLDRGLFVSSAETVLRIRGEGGPEALELVLQHDIVHGPIPIGELLLGRSPFHLVAAVVDTRLEVSEEGLPSIADALDGAPLLRLLAWLGFDRTAQLQLISPAFELPEGRLRSGGIDGQAKLDLVAGTLRGQLRAGPFSLKSDVGQVHFDTTTAEFGGDRGAEGDAIAGRAQIGSVDVSGPLLQSRLEPSRVEYTAMLVDGLLDFSTMDLTLGDYTAEGPAAVTALRAVTGLHVEERTGRSEQGEGLRDFDLSLDFDELVGSRRFGPGEAVLEVRNIDSAAIQGFQAAMKAIDAQALDELETNMQKMAAFEEWAPRILGPSPLLQLERLKMSSEEGEVRASFRVGVDASDPSMLGNPFIVLALVDAELDLGMPVPLVTSLLAGRHFCAGPPAPRPIHGMVPARPDPPFAQPVMVPFIGGYQLDTSLADQPEASVLATLGSAGFECRTMRAKLVDDTILVQKGDRYVLNARLQSGMPMLNGAPANPALFAGLVPGM